jgi:hypothetical protein
MSIMIISVSMIRCLTSKISWLGFLRTANRHHSRHGHFYRLSIRDDDLLKGRVLNVLGQVM